MRTANSARSQPSNKSIHERVQNELNDVVWDVTNTGTASIQPRLTTRSAGLSRCLRCRYSCCSQRVSVNKAECSTLARGTRAWSISSLCKVLIASPSSMYQAPLSSEQEHGLARIRIELTGSKPMSLLSGRGSRRTSGTTAPCFTS